MMSSSSSATAAALRHRGDPANAGLRAYGDMMKRCATVACSS